MAPGDVITKEDFNELKALMVANQKATHGLDTTVAVLVQQLKDRDKTCPHRERIANLQSGQAENSKDISEAMAVAVEARNQAQSNRISLAQQSVLQSISAAVGGGFALLVQWFAQAK